MFCLVDLHVCILVTCECAAFSRFRHLHKAAEERGSVNSLLQPLTLLCQLQERLSTTCIFSFALFYFTIDDQEEEKALVVERMALKLRLVWHAELQTVLQSGGLCRLILGHLQQNVLSHTYVKWFIRRGSVNGKYKS